MAVTDGLVQHHKVTRSTFRRRVCVSVHICRHTSGCPQHCRQMRPAFSTDCCADGYRILGYRHAMERSNVLEARFLSLTADSHIACRSLIHTCHAAPLPCSDSAVSFVKVCVVAGNIRTASPTLQQIVFFVVSYPLFTTVGMDRCEEDWYASDNNLRGIPRGSRKKPNAGR